MKDEFNALNPQRQPGPLVDALGGRVEQYYALDQPVKIAGLDGRVDGSADTWAELLSTASPDAKVLLNYTGGNGWLDGKPAMIARPFGKGTIAYLGTLPDAKAMRALITRVAFQAGTPPAADQLPEQVELCLREDSTKWVMVLINHGNTPAEATLYGRLRSLLPDISTAATYLPTMMPATKVTLPPQGVAVLEAEKTR
jgi:beta-galactosidase